MKFVNYETHYCLPETTEQALQQIAYQTGQTLAQLIQEAVEDYLAKQTTKILPKFFGIGASGMSNLSEKTKELLWLDK